MKLTGWRLTVLRVAVLLAVIGLSVLLEVISKIVSE